MQVMQDLDNQNHKQTKALVVELLLLLALSGTGFQLSSIQIHI